MMAHNVTAAQLHKALIAVNVRYEGNVTFNNLMPVGRRVRFTLKVKDSHGPGHRIGHSGKRMVSACWHVHGHFFEEVFKVEPKARIQSAGRGDITKDGGNWEDWDIGSRAQPLGFSDACECPE
jgi:hypothetical protein